MDNNNKNTLTYAHQLFLEKDYSKALFVYSQISSLEPTNLEYQLYCIFCDISYENSTKALEMFNKLTIDKDVDAILQDLQDYDDKNNKVVNILQDISLSNIASLNAIDYKDFIELVKSRGSFKEAYQDIMFSTKVAITNKVDLIDFIDKLIDNNFNNTAYNYLDGFNEVLTFDKDMVDLYIKLGKKNIDINS